MYHNWRITKFGNVDPVQWTCSRCHVQVYSKDAPSTEGCKGPRQNRTHDRPEGNIFHTRDNA